MSAVHAHTFHVHTFQLAKISKNPFFVLALSNILIFWDTELGFSLVVSYNHQN